MCPVLILTVAFWLVTGFMQLVSSLQIRIESPSSSNQLKLIESKQLLVSFVVDQLPAKVDLDRSRFHLMVDLKDDSVARLHSGPLPPPNASRSGPVAAPASQPPVQATIFDQQLFDRQLHQLQPTANQCRVLLRLQGENIGFTQLRLRLDQFDLHTDRLVDRVESSNVVDVLVTKEENTFWTNVFTVSVIVLVSLNNINMGCALDMEAVKSALASPIGPVIGLFSQYLFMPLLAYLIGSWLLADVPYLRLGLFIFGCSPGGSASNMWTVLLRGNLNLSITMTFLSTFGAMLMMPVWLFTLGRHSFPNNPLTVPYRNIVTILASMALFLALGLVVQQVFPKVAKVCRRILAPVSAILIAFIIVFGSVVYWYLFRLMNARVLFSAAANVWSGFVLGAGFACLCHQSRRDMIAIAIETGIQNTGVTFIVLRLAMESPYHDFAMTIPVAASIMSSLPLAAIYLCMKCSGTTGNDRKSESKQRVYANGCSEVQPAVDGGSAATRGDIETVEQAEAGGDECANTFDEAKLTGSGSVLNNFTGIKANQLNGV